MVSLIAPMMTTHDKRHLNKNLTHSYWVYLSFAGMAYETDRFGISLSPFTFFSREKKQKRQLKKRLIKEEQEYYVDRSFPKPWVASVTGLQGDSLTRFMILYRPGYSFCRKSNREQMLLYVSEKLKVFKKA